jgi:extradiol dioxygenase family protein
LIWAGLFVRDMEAAIAFYRDTLGLPMRKCGEDWAYFCDPEGNRLELKEI